MLHFHKTQFQCLWFSVQLGAAQLGAAQLGAVQLDATPVGVVQMSAL